MTRAIAMTRAMRATMSQGMLPSRQQQQQEEEVVVVEEEVAVVEEEERRQHHHFHAQCPALHHPRTFP
jgi:predicted anti-sigma-YlaC factor YlaD